MWSQHAGSAQKVKTLPHYKALRQPVRERPVAILAWSAQVAPLRRHRIGNALVRFAAQLPAILGRWQVALTRVCLVRPPGLSAYHSRLHIPGTHEQREVLQPQAGPLRGIVAELMRLDDLVGLADSAADDGNRVLDHDLVDWRGHEKPDEVQGILSQLRVAQAPGCPVHAAD